MIAVLIVSSIIHRCSEYIDRTVTVHAITSTRSAYAVENTKIIKEQKRRLSEIKFKGREKLYKNNKNLKRHLYIVRNTTTPVKNHYQT